MSDDFFGIDKAQYQLWKENRYQVCLSGMPLWIGLNRANAHIIERRSLSIEEWKSIVLSYPGTTNDCKCKPCRYRRWYGV